jgi:hypothetical protein
VGNYPDEEAFDTAIDENVALILDLPLPIDRICEISFEVGPKPIIELINGFSDSQHFERAVSQAAELRGIVAANSALVCYNLRLVDADPDWNGLLFLGTFAATP